MAETPVPPQVDTVPAAPPTPAAPVVDAATWAATQAKLATYEKAEADRKAADHQRTTAETERARKAGEYDKVIGAQTEELTALKARLAELEPDAQYGRETRAQQIARIDAAKKDLPEADQKLLAAVLATGGVGVADEMLQRLRAPVGKTSARPTMGGPPSPSDAPDFDKLAMESPKEFHDAVRKYPAEWNNHKEKLRGPQTRQPTLQERAAMKADAMKPAKAG